MKILAACGFGVGSSMILKMTLQKVLKEMDVDAEITNTDISKDKTYSADAIFTSHQFVNDLKSVTDIPIYPIRRYSDKEEVRTQVKKVLEDLNQQA